LGKPIDLTPQEGQTAHSGGDVCGCVVGGQQYFLFYSYSLPTEWEFFVPTQTVISELFWKVCFGANEMKTFIFGFYSNFNTQFLLVTIPMYEYDDHIYPNSLRSMANKARGMMGLFQLFE
jgi:hypothetical protein